MVPEGDPGQKKSTIQVSYLSEIVSTSRFGICKIWIISLGSEWKKCIFVLFWWIFTQPVFFLQCTVLFWAFSGLGWELGMSRGQFLVVHFLGFCIFGRFWHVLAFFGSFFSKFKTPIWNSENKNQKGDLVHLASLTAKKLKVIMHQRNYC